MTIFFRRLAFFCISLSVAASASAATTGALTRHEITVSGRRFFLDGEPFPYMGVSFFNAAYNPNFNRSPAERTKWLEKFRRYGITVLRVWCQWDNKRGLADVAPTATLYLADGRLREESLATIKAILADADRQGMVVELVLFARESWNDGIRLAPDAADRAVAAVTRELMPYRNVTFQVWNEFSDRVLDHCRTIKAIDPQRLVTNAPGYAGDLGDDAQNRALDYLTPHTSRQGSGRHWEVAPREIESLLKKYDKPVDDDEPARCGTPKYGGPSDRTYPSDHIVQMYSVWRLGAYANYHHDMFQLGYGHPSVPPSGIPDPEFSPYHKEVFEFIALRERYMPKPPAPQ
jgi:hypothetical protein